MLDPTSTKKITLGGGCFWCLEAVYLQTKGIIEVESGYASADSSLLIAPSYEEVCTGHTDFIEVVQLTYASAEISLEELLNIFFTIHDPTTPNRQGNDVGSQYRSAIFIHEPAQQTIANTVINALTQRNIWDAPIVTSVQALGVYYRAEIYHQNYYPNHSQQPYCQLIITPKVQKFRQLFAHLKK